jgi:hypothetical protein
MIIIEEPWVLYLTAVGDMMGRRRAKGKESSSSLLFAFKLIMRHYN